MMAVSQVVWTVSLVVLFVSVTFIFYVDSASNYVIDEYDEINLPFALDRCQHHSPIGTYVIYECPTDSDGTSVYKQFWEDEICPGNWSSRAMITDVTTTVSTDFESLECNSQNNRLNLATYCDFEVPAQRDLYLATDVCFDVTGDNSVYAKIDCSEKSNDANIYFWKGIGNCDSKSKADVQRELKYGQCNVFLNDTETGLGYNIYAESLSCVQEAKGSFMYSNILFNSIIIGIISIFGLIR